MLGFLNCACVKFSIGVCTALFDDMNVGVAPAAASTQCNAGVCKTAPAAVHLLSQRELLSSDQKMWAQKSGV